MYETKNDKKMIYAVYLPVGPKLVWATLLLYNLWIIICPSVKAHKMIEMKKNQRK